MRPLVPLVLVLSVAGCGAGGDDDDSAPAEAVQLVDHDDWIEVAEADDPFDDRPADVECSALSWTHEFIGEDALEVRTDQCNYLTVGQPAVAGGRAGDEMHVRLWHFQLDNFEPAEAHAAIIVGGELVWEVRHDIPSDSGMDSDSWDAPSDFEAGDEVLFHLHNHGSNTWNLIELSVRAR